MIWECAQMLVDEKIAELQEKGFCVLKKHFPKPRLEATRDAFNPILADYLKMNRDKPNRGPHRHFIAMPFEPPCFMPKYFFDGDVVSILHHVMDDKVVADHWGCDTPLRGSIHQDVHPDYHRPLFRELPDLSLPFYMVILSFGLIDITPPLGPIEIAPGTHSMPREDALR